MIHALITTWRWNCLYKTQQLLSLSCSCALNWLEQTVGGFFFPSASWFVLQWFFYSIFPCSCVPYISLGFICIPSGPWEQMMLQLSSVQSPSLRVLPYLPWNSSATPSRTLSVSCWLCLSHHWNCKSSSCWVVLKEDWGFIAFVPH